MRVRNGDTPMATRHAFRAAPTINDPLGKYWSDHVLVHNANTI
ncbi:hypothetical protein [Labrenzia sp. PHM005]|nr:hypothetical protein [Labrenzia sp. PHM005]